MADSKGKQSKFELVIGAMDRFSGVFKGFNDRVGSATAKMRALQQATASLGRATGISRLSGAVSGVAGSMRGAVTEGKNLIGTVSGLAGKLSLVFGAAGGGLFALAKSAATAGSEAASAASRAGVGLKTWQEYAYAANLAGLESGNLEKTFRELQDTAIEAFQGNKTKRSLLGMAGINPKTVKGEVKNADTLFSELADKVKSLNDAGEGAKATNLVKNLLGDKATQLMPLLSGGADGLRKMRVEAHKFNLVLDDSDTGASGAFVESLARMQGSLKGVGFALGRTLLPPLTKLMERFSEWFAVQGKIIAGGFAEWVAGIDLDRVFASIESGIATLGNLARTTDRVAQFFGGWKNVLLAVGAIIAGKFLSSLFTLAGAFAKLGLAIMSTPVGWFLGAVALIGGAVYAIYKNWDGIVAYFQGLWQGVQAAFGHSWVDGILAILIDFNPVRLIAKGMNELFAYFTGIDLFEHGSRMIASLGEGFGSMFPRLSAWFGEQIDSLTGWMPNWVKEKLGLGSARAALAGASGQGAAAPLNLGPASRSISEARSEHVEKNELTIRVKTDDGAEARVIGAPGPGVTVSQVGVLAAGG